LLYVSIFRMMVLTSRFSYRAPPTKHQAIIFIPHAMDLANSRPPPAQTASGEAHLSPVPSWAVCYLQRLVPQQRPELMHMGLRLKPWCFEPWAGKSWALNALYVPRESSPYAELQAVQV